jgi:hypothetical protein
VQRSGSDGERRGGIQGAGQPAERRADQVVTRANPALTLQAACHANGAVNQTQCEKRAKPLSLGLAAWVVQACGVEGKARGIADTGQAGTSLANGADFLRRAVRDFAVEYQRLLEASELELAPPTRHFGLRAALAPRLADPPTEGAAMTDYDEVKRIEREERGLEECIAQVNAL